MGDLLRREIDAGEACLGETLRKYSELGPDTAADLQDVSASGVIDPAMNPWDQMLRLVDEALLLLRGEGVDVSLGHGGQPIARSISLVASVWVA